MTAITTAPGEVQQKPSTFPSKVRDGCISMAKGTVQCVKRLGLGMVAGAVGMPLFNIAPIYLAQKTGLIPEMTNQILSKTLRVNDKLFNNTCLIEKPISKFPYPTCPLRVACRDLNLPITPSQIKITNLVALGVIPAVGEELLFRGLIQDVLLKRLPAWMLKKISPGQEKMIDTKIAKIGRIILTSALFSAWHLQNRGILPDAYVKSQLVGTFTLGILLGMIKESNLGLLGSMGAHFANNTIAISPILLGC